ncbi:MAG: CopG family transcriptional regulator [Spirochaetes bacterium]|nr:CopG family transcriptional regulator [Spirochaetota bacterium]
MPKTITLRIDDDTYTILKTAADAERRTISNFIEYAAISHISEEAFVDDVEMNEIMNNKKLTASFNRAREDVKKGKYKIVT